MLPIGKRRKREDSLPISSSWNRSITCPRVCPVSGPFATMLWWSERSLSTHASDRKAAEARRQLAHQLFLESLHHLSKGLPCQRSIRNHALVVRTVAEHPCFRSESGGSAKTACPSALLGIAPSLVQGSALSAVHSQPCFGGQNGR